ncbi:MAG: hypothetical protein ACYC0V_01205 [Armatimonadota bacterium]
MRNFVDAAYIMGVLMIISQIPAHAYIDGGTGSYVMQIAVAMFLGVGYAFKANVSKMFTKIRRNNKNNTESSKNDRK